MSIWTSSLCGLGLAVALALAGCDAVPGAAPGPASQTVQVGGAVVTVAGPRGYCVDRRASRQTGAAPVVLFAPCGPDRPARPAVLTATVAPAGPGRGVAGNGAALEAFMRSEAGRAALARSGKAGDVTILGSVVRDGAVMVYLRDQSPPTEPGLSAAYRRAFLDVPGALVTVSVLGFAADPLGDPESRALLDAFVAAIRTANPASATAGAG